MPACSEFPLQLVEIIDYDGSLGMIEPRRLTPPQARAARVGRYRYAAFAIRGPWCATQLITFDARGDTLWEADSDEFAETPYNPARLCPVASPRG